MKPRVPEVLADGVAFAEGPRWHDGRLWFSDMHFHKVMTVDLHGNLETIVEVPNRPSGLGWLPDGRLLVVSMMDRRLLRLDESGLTEVADLSKKTESYCNDMVVDSKGQAYIGNFGFDLYAEEPPRATFIAMVRPDGSTNIVADDLLCPNGMVITAEGKSLIVAESWGLRLTAFDISDEGSLSNRRIFAALGNRPPDGICLDAEGAVWVASPMTQEVVRIREGGEVVDRVSVVDRGAIACMLGGPDRKKLFICTALTTDPEEARRMASGRIEMVEVDVPGAGLP